MINYTDIIIDEKGKEDFLNRVNDLAQEKIDRFKKDMFKSISRDIEFFMEKRLDNLKYKICNAVVSYLLGRETDYISEKNKTFIEKFIGDIGFTANKFRKKIFKENKEEILKDITADFIYESLKYSFEQYFGIWEYKDLSIAYPQSKIIERFAEYFVKHIDKYDKILDKEIDKELLEKIDKLKELESKIINAEKALKGE